MHAHPMGTGGAAHRRGRPRLAALPNPTEEEEKFVEAERRARAQLADAEAAGVPLTTATGKPRSLVTLPEYRRGRAPANKGKRYPVEVLTPSEIAALLETFPSTAAGARSRALVVLLWRSGLRISEALALRVEDLDLERGAITVLRGKGAKRRVAGIDPHGAAYVRAWLAARAELEVPDSARLFCTISNDAGGPGRPLQSSSVREHLKRYARKAGIRKRVHPHGFRHTFAFDSTLEGLPMIALQAQLGHTDLATTAHYANHLAPQQLLSAIGTRAWPLDAPAPPTLTRAAASQGSPAPATGVLIPDYSPVPREPPVAADREAGARGAIGETKAKVLAVLRANSGRATQAQLARAVGVRNITVRRHCEQLAAAGLVVRLGEVRRGGSPLVVWGLAPLRAVFELDTSVELGTRARSGQGPERVLTCLRRIGGRASQARLAGELGISSGTVARHCQELERRGLLEPGGWDKASCNRGSRVWRLPSRGRLRTPATGHTLQMVPGSSTAGGKRS